MALWKENNPTVPAASKGPVSPARYHRGINDASNGHDHRSKTGQSSNGGGSGEGTSSNSNGSGSQHQRLPSGESRVPEVYLQGLDLTKKIKEERIDEDCGVRDLRERIRGMKRWRREIERTVVWQREEYRRVQTAIGKQSVGNNGEGGAEKGAAATTRKVVQFDVEGEGEGKGKGKERAEPVKMTGVLRGEGWGVGGQTWEKKRLVSLFEK